MPDFNPHVKRDLFLAQVQSVRLEDEPGPDGRVLFAAGTIDVMPPAHRMGIKGVRVLGPNTAHIKGNPRGFYWLPNIGDWVVCGYLEGYPDHAICFGAIFNPGITPPPQAALSIDGKTLQMWDIVLQHQTGSYLRFRNRKQPYKDSTGNWVEPVYDLSEITINHDAGDTFQINEVTLGKTQFTYTHNSGAQFKIDQNGNITLKPASGKLIKVGSDSSSESLVLGDSFKTWLDSFIANKVNMHIHPTGVGPSSPPILGGTGAIGDVVPANTLSGKAKTEL